MIVERGHISAVRNRPDRKPRREGGWPRIKPPFPAVEGAFRKPTVVNNIETLACVTHVIDRGRIGSNRLVSSVYGEPVRCT